MHLETVCIKNEKIFKKKEYSAIQRGHKSEI
jgi:hypothetical protein